MSHRNKSLIKSTIDLLKDKNFLVSEQTKDSQFCFDIAARKNNLNLLFKILSDINIFEEIQANELKILSKVLLTKPIIIGERTKNKPIEDGVVYQRFQIPAINIKTLHYLLKENLFPLVYAKRGGYYVKLDSNLLREVRELHKLSLKAIGDELGVTRKTIYEYERGSMDSTLKTASKLEEIFGTALTIPINIFEWQFDEANYASFLFKSKLQMRADKLLSHLGLQTFWTERTPFNILAFYRPFTLLTSLLESSEINFNEKLNIIKSISKVFNSHSLLIVNDKKNAEDIEGIPVISKSELERIKKLETLLDIIESYS